jgi:hypothetical protein
MRPGAKLFVQSAEIRHPDAQPGELLITDFVRLLRERSAAIVRREARYAAYRPVLDDAARMAAYQKVYEQIFQPARPLSVFVEALQGAGFTLSAASAPVAVGVDEWYQAASVYSDIVGWIGGVASVDGQPPSAAAMADRLAILDLAKREVFGGRDTFDARWTYLTGQRAA